MEQVFGAYDKVITIIVHNFGKQAEIDLNVGFYEGALASTLLIDQFTTYVMRLAEISTHPDDLTDEYIAEQFMSKELKHWNTEARFHIHRSDYGDDTFYGMSIHLDITDMYIEFRKKRLHRVVHWAWDRVGFPSLQTQLQMTFDEGLKNGSILMIDDSELSKYDYDKGWKIKLGLPSDRFLTIAGTYEYFTGSWPNSSHRGKKYVRSKDPQVIRDIWNKDIGDITYYAVNDFIDGDGKTIFEDKSSTEKDEELHISDGDGN